MQLNGLHIQRCPVYGALFGILYYDPNLEPDKEKVDPEDFYQEITLCFVFIGIKITWW